MKENIREFYNELKTVSKQFKTTTRTSTQKEITTINHDFFNHDFFKNDALNPFKDKTYTWAEDFLLFVLDRFEFDECETKEELINALNDFEIHEFCDSETDLYTSDLTDWLNENNENVYYLTEAQNETDDGFSALQLAQYRAIEETAQQILRNLIEWIENEIDEDGD